MSTGVHINSNECEFFSVNTGKCEFVGPFECSACGGHIMFDATFVDQVTENMNCPYCDLRGKVVE